MEESDSNGLVSDQYDSYQGQAGQRVYGNGADGASNKIDDQTELMMLQREKYKRQLKLEIMELEEKEKVLSKKIIVKSPNMR